MTPRRVLQIVVSLVLLGVLFFWIDGDAVWKTVADADPLYLLLALGLISANRVLMAVKWNLLLRAKGIHVSHVEVTKVYYMSTFLGVFLPPTVGGDVVRAYAISRRGPPLPDVITSILVERLIGMITLLVFGALACVIFITMFAGVEFEVSRLLAGTAILSVLVIGGFVFSLSDRFGRIMGSVLERFSHIKILGKASRKFEKLFDSYRDYWTRKGTLTAFFFLTCLENALPIIRPWLVALALHTTVPLAYFFVIVPIELVLIRIPLTFDGFGIREGLFVYFLALIGIPESTGFGIGIVNHMLFLVALLPGGILCLLEGGAKRVSEGPPSDAPTAMPTDRTGHSSVSSQPANASASSSRTSFPARPDRFKTSKP